MFQFFADLLAKLRGQAVAPIPEPEPKREVQTVRHINQIIIHCAATPPHLDWGVEDIRRLHTRSFKWSDIGYHWVIRRDGTLEQGRPEERAGAHARGHNANSIGICLVGGIDTNGKPASNFTPSQLKTLRRIVDEKLADYPGSEVIGHRDTGAKKACPSFDVATWLATGKVTGANA